MMIKVKCINRGINKPLTLGKVYRVVSDKSEYWRIICDDGTEGNYCKYRFEVLDPKDQPKVSNSDREWSFGISGIPMLDFEKVAEALSYSNPIAFVEVIPKKDDSGLGALYIVAHESLFEKANATTAKHRKQFNQFFSGAVGVGPGYMVPVPMITKTRTEVTHKVVREQQKNGKWISRKIKVETPVHYPSIDITWKAKAQKIAGAIKGAPFRASHKLQATVKVSLPKV